MSWRGRAASCAAERGRRSVKTALSVPGGAGGEKDKGLVGGRRERSSRQWREEVAGAAEEAGRSTAAAALYYYRRHTQQARLDEDTPAAWDTPPPSPPRSPSAEDWALASESAREFRAALISSVK